MLLYVLVRLKECFRQTPPPPLPADCMLPELTLFITAYNEEDVVDDKSATAFPWTIRQTSCTYSG